MENQEKENDRLQDIQDRMNGMEVKKRKHILVIFAVVCASIILLRMVVSLGGCTRTEKVAENGVSEGSMTQSEKLRVLEHSLEPQNRKQEVEDFMQKLVDEDRKEMEKKNGEKGQ